MRSADASESPRPLVSVITPTFGREGFLAQTRKWIEHQSYRNIEWLILDDSPQPCRALAGCTDPQVRYQHITQRLTIGEKRNRLVDKAKGEIIAHFDDDDYYSPSFLDVMVAALTNNRAYFANLSAWYVYDFRHEFFGYWDLNTIVGTHYLCYRDQLRLATISNANNANLLDNFRGYGFTYVYRRQVWEANPFATRDWGEDLEFAKAALSRFQLSHLANAPGLVLHTLHRNSSSSCFPQYHLPNFLLPVLFPEYEAAFQAITQRGP